MVTRGQPGHVSPDPLHDPSALMSEDRRRWNPSLVSRGEVGVANARGDDSDEHLVRPRLVQVKLCEFERVGVLAKNSGGDLHQSPFYQHRSAFRSLDGGTDAAA
jgi:hypothetical protein